MVNFKNFMFGASTAALAFTMATPVSFAADESIEEVVVTGSRRPARSGAETPAPVDVISGSDLQNQGDGDMSNLLRNIIPSYNVNAQPISDAATFVRPFNMRGMSPDHTLILVNGKRRHRAAVIAFLGGGISDGAQPVDTSAIPAMALKRVEVLRDGASAQYGSDAIAGVVNFILNDSAEGATFEVKYGSTYAGDGETYTYGANYGMALGSNGFANFTVEYREADATSRSVQRDDAQGLIDGGLPVREPYAQIWGQPDVRNDWKAFLNMGVEAGENREFYAFGSYNQREVEGGFFFRNPTNRSGVYASGGNILVADLTPDDANVCPAGPANDAATLAALAADPLCFAFNEMLPGGFTPQFGAHLNDVAFAAGLRGEMENGMKYDVSAHAGRNEADFFMKNTINASMGPDTPRVFRPGTYIQTEKNVNADFSYGVDMGMSSDLNVAFGAEWREEQFEVLSGDEASWKVGPYVDQGFSLGSNGFNGFQPSMAGSNDRTSKAAYLDLEADVTDALTLGGAVRYEDFSDFGNTTNFKVSGLYRVTDGVSLRSTYSTGFRAPTIGQSTVRNVTTAFSGGVLSNKVLVPPTDEIAQYFGSSPLKPETSKNFSLGTAFKLGEADVTLDYFHITMKDRITQTADFELDATAKAALLAAGVSSASDTSAIRFFTNDFSSKTDGLDLVVTYPLHLTDEGTTTLNSAFNYTNTKVTSFDPTDPDELLNQARVDQLEKNLPRYRGNISLQHEEGSWRALARLNYYGKYTELHLDEPSLAVNPGSEITLDAEFGYKVMDGLHVIVGAENILGNYPDLNQYGGVAGAKYPVTSPMGFNGGFYYVRVRYEM